MAENVHSYDNLFAEFSPSSHDEWLEATVKSLKGKPFEKLIKATYEGIDLQPMYRAEDIENITHKGSLPGQYPYIRGTKAEGYQSQPWLIAQDINLDNSVAFNEALKHGLAHGQTAINTRFNFPHYIRLNTLQTLFNEIDLETYPLFIQADYLAVEFVSLFVAYLRLQKKSVQMIRGNIGYDPVHYLMSKGDLGGTPESEIFDRMAMLTKWATKNMSLLETIAIHTESYHTAGASAVQEIAIAMATGVTYISEMLERGLDIDTIAQKMRFFLSVGENFFMEIAKLRAIKMMWAQIVREFGGDAESQKIKIHASTGARNKSRLDPHVNMLRVTTEAMAGAIGGVDSMSVAPFDAPFGESDDFSRRIARNVQLILQEEVNLTEVIDPAGGSWYVEYLTDQLAQSAWTYFQQIEAQGGIVQSLQDEIIQNNIDGIAKQRIDNISTRRDILVGTNMFPNLDEEQIEERISTTDYSLVNPDINYDLIMTKTGLEMMDALIGIAEKGASISQLARAQFKTLDEHGEINESLPIRLSKAFENLRSNAEDYRQSNGHHPQIFLANFGELSDYKARMDFTQGFYEVGGFELINQGGYNTIASAVNASLSSAAKAVVICSTDAKYAEVVPDFAQAIKAQKPEMIVILAGYPQDKVDEYRQAGVDEFIHIRANCYEMNKELQTQLGVGK